MEKAMTSKEANDRFLCKMCQEGEDCGWNCVESATCSMRCKDCGARCWFTGDLHRAPAKFRCGVCDAVQTNEWAEEAQDEKPLIRIK